MPQGSGLGVSSCLGVGLLGAALGVEAGEGLASKVPILRDLESMELQTPTGWQDYYPAALGGALALHWDGPAPRWERLEPHPGLLADLVVFYTGRPHHSGMTNWEAYKRFIEGDAQTLKALSEIREIARDMAQALPSDPLRWPTCWNGKGAPGCGSPRPWRPTPCAPCATGVVARAGTLG